MWVSNFFLPAALDVQLGVHPESVGFFRFLMGFQCHTHPVAAPNVVEKSFNYLWRFWTRFPKQGEIAIFDRTWYGRVMVERIEGFATQDEWGRAYAEINDFEAQLRAPRNVVVKYWLHISQEEQLRRFRERENTPWKQYKITDEDWRNREKFPAYMEAAEEIFARTSTEDAPWHIVPAEDKKYARLEVVRIYRDTLKKALKRA